MTKKPWFLTLLAVGVFTAVLVSILVQLFDVRIESRPVEPPKDPELPIGSGPLEPPDSSPRVGNFGWVSSSSQELPPENAFVAGIEVSGEENTSQPIYLCRAEFDERKIPGATVNNECHIPFHDAFIQDKARSPDESIYSSYEVLVHDQPLIWIDHRIISDEGVFPPNVLSSDESAGYKQGTIICRTLPIEYEISGYRIGVVIPSKRNLCAFAQDGEDSYQNNYEVLVMVQE
ncbi:MAG: hypothetical protein ACFB8W_08450 [Elainellaceae cyanobacterium]